MPLDYLPGEIRDKINEISKFILSLYDMEEDELDEIDAQFTDNRELHDALIQECECRYHQMISHEERRRESLYYPQIANKWMCEQFLPTFHNGQKISPKQYDIFTRYGTFDRYNRTCLTANSKIYKVSSYNRTLEIIEF